MDRTTTSNAPVETFRDGRLKATVWENTGDNGTYHTVSLAKVYEDREGKLQETNSFSGAELLRVAELAREAHAFTRDLRREVAIERQAERPAGRAPERAAPREETSRGGRESRPQRFARYASPGPER